MSPLRNTGRRPTQPRHMARVGTALGSAAAAGLTALTVACADGPTAPGRAPAPAAAPALALSGTGTSSPTSYVVSQTKAGDTTVTKFVVGTVTTAPAAINIGNSSRVDFPYAAGSICDPATSSYGPGQWDAKCAASKASVTITAKSWLNEEGKVATDFQPAMRFVPGLRKGVTITLKDAALAGTRVDFCDAAGVCVNEAAADPSLAATLDPYNGFVTRVVKHFSGYTVVANRTRIY